MTAEKGSLYGVSNDTRQRVLAARCERATNPVTRGFGLMGRASLPEDGGLILQPCNGVVTFFMRFPIDVLFIGEDGKARRLIHAMKPWKASSLVKGAKLAVEFPAGTLAGTGTEVGDAISFDPPL